MAKRRTKLNEGRYRAIIAALSAGLPPSVAATAVGIATPTLESWVSRGRSTNAPALFRRFATDYDDARAKGEYALAMVVIESALKQRDVRSAMWLLERLHPHNWSKQASLQIQHSGQVQLSPRDELEAGRARLLELVPGEVVDGQEASG